MNFYSYTQGVKRGEWLKGRLSHNRPFVLSSFKVDMNLICMLGLSAYIHASNLKFFAIFHLPDTLDAFGRSHPF